VYLKHYHSLNKQFSIDSFLDWEGLLLGFRYAPAHALFALPLSQVTSPLLNAHSTERAIITISSNDKTVLLDDVLFPTLDPGTCKADAKPCVREDMASLSSWSKEI